MESGSRPRKQTRPVRAGNLDIGGGAPVSLQSMTSVPLEDVDATVDQIQRLHEAGADLVRVAVRNLDAVQYLREVCRSVTVPLSADIHFNHAIAIESIKAGVRKIRINPGNIGDAEKVREVVRCAKDYGVPIRIGVNGGSVDKKKYPEVTPRSLVDSAMEHVHILEDNGFSDIVVSIKSSDIFQTIEANKIFSATRDYPVHIGLTEAGYGMACVVQSSIVIGHLLLVGIGDTVRVSMTGDPVQEVIAGRRILESLGEKYNPLKIISCPTCGRTDPELDLYELAGAVEAELTQRFGPVLGETGRTLTVAIMGCEVNGPGEASHADAGLAGGRAGAMLLFAQGQKIKKVHRDNALSELSDEVERIIRTWEKR
ncbi:MAG TPA: flavodoxin-dependent (E)-4-hydroxy-3-methylbut-2-enyl-diphosphate synthase [Spirochaetota bacterium]|nr:flavodoxin-dependent (E)-4-hydroxy-3-methylbut-2-enyl-diphosphate synthase [Spirochaetota bacterium]